MLQIKKALSTTKTQHSKKKKPTLTEQLRELFTCAFVLSLNLTQGSYYGLMIDGDSEAVKIMTLASGHNYLKSLGHFQSSRSDTQGQGDALYHASPNQSQQ